MFLVPELVAKRILPVHMNVIEPFGRHVALIFDDRSIGTLQICEPGATGRLNTVFRFSDLRFRQAKDSACPRPRIAADEHKPAFVRSVEWQQLHFWPVLVSLQVLADVRDVPTEVPDRGL